MKCAEKGRKNHGGNWFAAYDDSRGVTLIDTLVGVALMLVVFLGIFAAFELSVDVVTNNKARAGAIELADQRMEYIRSLTYSVVGTVGGIPSGSIPQSETVVLNGVTYTRRTVIEYEDDQKDSPNGSTENYKAVKVDVAWTSQSGTRHITLVTRVSPTTGLATTCTSCGTLLISVVNASSSPFSGASVSIMNASTSPAVNINTFSNASGTVEILGVPTGSGYSIVVTNTNYSTAQTYSATSQNTNPNPGNLTVSNNETTSGTFAIDVLGSMTIQTWTQILSGTWTAPFSNTSEIATSTNITVSDGNAHLTSLASSGNLQSIAIAPSYLATWGSVSWTNSQPSGTSILYHVYDGAGVNLIPESQLPGNSAGFTTSPINLGSVSTSTYPSISLFATLSPSASSTPSISSWGVSYTYGPTPLPNIAFTLQGSKTIGSGPSGTLYKYSQNLSSGSASSLTIPNLEWDTYAITVNGASTGYDIASSCNPQPESLSPGASLTTKLFLAAHTTNSLLIDVRSSSTGALLPGASAHVTASGYNTALTTDSCGQAFFPGLTSGSYSITVSATGHTTYSNSNYSVSGTTRLSVSI